MACSKLRSNSIISNEIKEYDFFQGFDFEPVPYYHTSKYSKCTPVTLESQRRYMSILTSRNIGNSTFSVSSARLTAKLCITSPARGIDTVTCELLLQRTSCAESVSISWRHHAWPRCHVTTKIYVIIIVIIAQPTHFPQSNVSPRLMEDLNFIKLRYTIPNALVYHSKYVFQLLWIKSKFWYPFQSIIKW